MKACIYEDFDNAECINCFNGLPHTCPADELDRKMLRDMAHKRDERKDKKYE